jgi:enamine deaminase RidA (YjgF/YER057c/UK114 family)
MHARAASVGSTFGRPTSAQRPELMAAAARLRIHYPRLADIRDQPATWWREVLAIVHYAPETPGREPPSLPLADLPAARVMMPVLAGLDGTVEVWRLAGPMSSGQHGRVRYRRGDRLLFAALSIAEQEFADSRGDARAQGLRDATRAAYHELFAALTALGYPHPLRIWNVLPEINGQTRHGERYWLFNVARQEAFMGMQRAIRNNVPAASALGSPQPGPVTVYCIAGAEAPIALENPRQAHAWDYPAQYGPRSPTFARACIEPGPAPILFVSGTSSIVGYETAHAGDVRAQTQETVRNIRAVLAAANQRLGIERFALDRLSYKVYVRRSEDLQLIEHELRQAIGPAPPALYLKADICRRDLLVEIEAVGCAA